MSKKYNTEYWSCECPARIIEQVHPKTETFCEKCDSYASSQPNTTVEDVERYQVELENQEFIDGGNCFLGRGDI